MLLDYLSESVAGDPTCIYNYFYRSTTSLGYLWSFRIRATRTERLNTSLTASKLKFNEAGIGM